MENSDTKEVTRQDLYDQIWSEPVSKVCRRLGLSDVGLAKLCARWEIPRPPRGYWAKRANGKRVTQRALKPIEEGNPVLITASAKPSEDLPKLPPTEADKQRVFENLSENRIQVPAAMVDPHPLVERTASSIRAAAPDEKGLSSPRAKKCLDVAVAASSIDRAMLIMDTLLKALTTRGLTLKVEDEPSRRILTFVLGESVAFSLFEHTDRRERPATKAEADEDAFWRAKRVYYQRVPNGKLALTINSGSASRRTWSDGGGRKVEGFLNSFVVGLFRAAESIKQDRIKDEKRKLEWAEAERRRQEAEKLRWQQERLRQEELVRIRDLKAQAAAWLESQKLATYLTAVREVAMKQFGTLAPDSNLAKWLDWATQHVEALDPINSLKQNRMPQAPPPEETKPRHQW